MRQKPLTRRCILLGGASLPLLGCTQMSDAAPVASGRFFDLEGTRLHYTTGGKGPPVVLLHGASGHLKDWTFQLFEVLTKSYRVLAFDRPGLGFSVGTQDTVSLEGQVRVMQKAARNLGFEGATVVGHSFGGSVALNWALSAPAETNGLVLIAAPSQVWPGSAGPLYDIANTPLIGPALSALVPVLATERRVNQAVTSIFAPQNVPKGYLEHMQPEISLRPAVFRANTAQVGRLKDDLRVMVPEYGRLAIPVELIHGTYDQVVPIDIHSEKTVKMIPNARLTRLEGVGHMPHQTHSDAFFKALARVT